MSTNYSCVLTQTPQQILPAVSSLTTPAPRVYWRIINVAPTGGGTAWLTRFGQSPAVNAAGSYPLAPGATEEFDAIAATNLSSHIPTEALWGVSSSGSVPLTIEVSPA